MLAGGSFGETIGWSVVFFFSAEVRLSGSSCGSATGAFMIGISGVLFDRRPFLSADRWLRFSGMHILDVPDGGTSPQTKNQDL